ncbi:MAG: nucleotidyltransferase family protein [Planctomycetota bacterium]|jgi:NDP-sugar pyrophosphorylase family protein
MDAMILAAGRGTRLRPLTDTIPKALIEVAGLPMLERVARRMIAAGADRLIINVHHFADQIERFIASKRGFGVDVRVSREPDRALETGGGLYAARASFRGDAPFLLHNVDVLSELPLESLVARHAAEAPLATVAVMDRPTRRYLLFDDLGLCGRIDLDKDVEVRARDAVGEIRRLAFSGVHVISPAIFERITERGAFSILDPYLRLAGEGARILPFRADGWPWLDVGRVEQLERAEERYGTRAD